MKESNSGQDANLNRTLEVFIKLGLLILLAGVCLLILRPFVPLILWGIIISIAAYPSYRKLQNRLSGRSRLAAVIWTCILLALFVIPVVLLTGSLVDGVQGVAARLNQGATIIPPPPPRVEHWPLI